MLLRVCACTRGVWRQRRVHPRSVQKWTISVYQIEPISRYRLLLYLSIGSRPELACSNALPDYKDGLDGLSTKKTRPRDRIVHCTRNVEKIIQLEARSFKRKSYASKICYLHFFKWISFNCLHRNITFQFSSRPTTITI